MNRSPLHTCMYLDTLLTRTRTLTLALALSSTIIVLRPKEASPRAHCLPLPCSALLASASVLARLYRRLLLLLLHYYCCCLHTQLGTHFSTIIIGVALYICTSTCMHACSTTLLPACLPVSLTTHSYSSSCSPPPSTLRLRPTSPFHLLPTVHVLNL